MLLQPHPRGALFKFKIMNQKPLTVEEFEALPGEQQRVLVAQDAIANLAAQRYKALKGSYISMRLFGENVEDLDVRTNFEVLDKIPCHVCVMGACLLSVTRFRNKLTFYDVNISGLRDDKGKAKNSFSLFAGLFEPKQLLLMEDSYEGLVNEGEVWDWEGLAEQYDEYSAAPSRIAKDIFGYDYLKEERYALWARCQDFFENYEEDEDRFLAIMENIVKNKGEFIP
jgi:hypothetical protein